MIDAAAQDEETAPWNCFGVRVKKGFTHAGFGGRCAFCAHTLAYVGNRSWGFVVTRLRSTALMRCVRKVDAGISTLEVRIYGSGSDSGFGVQVKARGYKVYPSCAHVCLQKCYLY